MSLKRDGFGCLPLLATSVAGIGATLWLGPLLGTEGVPALPILAFCLLPLAYFWTPKPRRSSVTLATFSASKLHRRVRSEIGNGQWIKAPGFKRRRTTLVMHGDLPLPLEVRRLKFRKNPDVRARIKLPPSFPRDLSIKSTGLLGGGARDLGDPAFDSDVALRGDHPRLLALFDADLRSDVARWVDDHVLTLSDGELAFEVHGLDVRKKGLDEIRAFVALTRRLIDAADAPLGDRLHDRARTDPVATVRSAAARALWSLEPDTHRATALRTDWLRPSEPPLHRITASEGQEVGVTFATLSRLLTDPNTPTAFVALAARRLGDLDHPDVVPTLQGLMASDPDVQKAVAEALARRGHAGGGLALAEGGGGELAMAGTQQGDLAMAGTQQGDLALEEAAEAPPRRPKQKA